MRVQAGSDMTLASCRGAITVLAAQVRYARRGPLFTFLGAVLVVLMLLPSVPVAAVGGPYSVLYEVRLDPAKRTAEVTIQLGQGADRVRSIELRTKPGRYQHFSGDGQIEEVQGGVRWRPPKEGGALRYSFLIDHQRAGGGYDSHMTDTWAIMRGDDVVPPARVRTRVDARAQARLRFELPPKWSAATPFQRDRDGGYRLENPRRRFVRPTGWLVFGRLGVLRERIGNTRVIVAGPVRQGLRRHDLLALVHWTLPALESLRRSPLRTAAGGRCGRSHVARRALGAALALCPRRTAAHRQRWYQPAAP